MDQQGTVLTFNSRRSNIVGLMLYVMQIYRHTTGHADGNHPFAGHTAFAMLRGVYSFGIREANDRKSLHSKKIPEGFDTRAETSRTQLFTAAPEC